jgi:HK97 gp10 family phage protein
MIDTYVEGIDALAGAVEAIKKNEAKLLRVSTVAGVRVILKAAKEKCPVSVDGHHSYTGGKGKPVYYPPGNLRRSIKMKVLKPAFEGVQAVLIGPVQGRREKHDGWYGRLVEQGTSKMGPQPFMRPAFDENIERAYQVVAVKYTEGLGETAIKDIDDVADILFDSLAGGD